MWARKSLLLALLAVEGFLLLRPDGTLVHAARNTHGDHSLDQANYWWRKSPVHMGCSISSCSRLATRVATYRQLTPRGATWRAYGFCDLHDPPGDVEKLVYRLGRPKSFGYDVPLTPLWAQVYFLLGALGFGIWCAGMWKYANARATAVLWAGFAVLHLAVLTVLWKY
jgi:hypothetical protein